MDNDNCQSLPNSHQRRRRGRELDPRTLTGIQRQVLGEAEVAAYCGFGRAYLRQKRMEGEGPPYLRIGRSIRYLRRDLDAWLEAHRAPTRAPETKRAQA